jgi:Transglycosylase SLT domain
MSVPDERGDAPERRTGDRRRDAGTSEPREAQKGTSPLTQGLRVLGAIVVLLVTIVFAVRNTRPIYTTQGTVGQALRARAPAVARAIIPTTDSSTVAKILASPKFQAEKQNFYQDLMRLHQVDSARADSIATYAVREAYVRGISPAIIFGVMLTENAQFISKATSSVGAVGLMQVYPKVWATKEMTSMLGKDLSSDSTNVKFGVFILNKYFHPRTSSGQVQTVPWQTALLHYNGCVNGTNTPRCHTYPNKVQQYVVSQAKSICNGRGFYDCIAKPFIDGLFANAGEEQTASR